MRSARASCIRSTLAALAAAILIGAPAPPATAADAPAAAAGRLASLAWLAGSWGHDSAGVRVEEHWMAPGGGLMLGMAREVAGGRVRSFEFLRIREWGDSLAYLASPGGRPPTPFPVKELGDHRVVFENLAHDYPQRISYRLGADGRLTARTEGMVRGRLESEEWVWSRAALGP